MSTQLDQALAALMPTERHYVMDLLEQNGLDISRWHVTGDGKVVKALPRPKLEILPLNTWRDNYTDKDQC